jgi:amidohydrolase
MVAAAQVITALQTIVSRNISPLLSAVVSVTSVHGGDAFNVIPSEVKLLGTIRTSEPDVRQQVLARFHPLVLGIAEAMNCQAEVEAESLTPAVINDARVAARVKEAAGRVLPASTLDPNFHTMVSEDMALMMQGTPGCYFFVGSANSEKGLDALHHHPRFDFDEQVLPRAVALMASAAVELLG